MDNLAKWMGLVEAINHTGKKAYFKSLRSGSLRFICNINKFDPRDNVSVYVALVDAVVKRGAEITVHHKKLKNSTYVRFEAVMEIDRQIYRALGVGCQPAIVNCIRKYIDNLERDGKL